MVPISRRRGGYASSRTMPSSPSTCWSWPLRRSPRRGRTTGSTIGEGTGAAVGYHEDIIQMILDGRISDKDELQRVKIELCRHYGLPGVPPNSETLAQVREEDLPMVEEVLRRKPVRTLSGVAVVAVMTSPAPCPHGKCIYCPGGVESGSPQSYTGKEPAARRGASYDFDPYEQVKGRIEQLEAIGHGTDKIDLIVMGGTFTSRP